MNRIFACLLFLASALVLSSCSNEAGISVPKAHLVCVGLDYQNCTVATLPGTVADATEVCACLESIYTAKGLGCESVLMLSEGPNSNAEEGFYPSADNIRKTLFSLRPQSGDLVVFYWSGHGHRDRNGMFLAAAADGTQEYTKLYASELLEWAGRLCCSAVLILDSCYSGNAVEDCSTDFLQSLKTLTQQCKETNVCILAACADESLSYVTSVPGEDGPSRAHSVFTASMLRVLGWQCSANRTTKVLGRNAEGYLAALPPRINTTELTELVLKDMALNKESEKQVPETTGTAFPVFLIP